MLSTKQLKYLKSLHQSKFRQKYGNFIAEGVKTASEIIENGQFELEGVYALNEWLASHQGFLSQMSQDIVHPVNEKELKHISLLQSPNQVLFVLKQKDWLLSKKTISSPVSIYLDKIRDPGNMGTILRIADWFGIRWVFCSEGCVDIYNPKVVQASMGAFLRINTANVSLFELKQMVPELPILGMSLDGYSIYDRDLPGQAIIVIGNESKGISREFMELITEKISIPRHTDGGAESLNAAIATGIICSMIKMGKRKED